MHWPVTVIKTGLIDVHIHAARDHRVCPIPFAAICAVPKVAMRAPRTTFAIWNRDCSAAFGTAICRILPAISWSVRNRFWPWRQTSFSWLKHRNVITTAAKYQDMVVGQATPAAPARSTNTPIALPITLIRFMAIETIIVVLVLPMLR